MSRLQVVKQHEAFQAAARCLGCSHEGQIVTNASGEIVDVDANAGQILEELPTRMEGRNIRDYCLLRESYDAIWRHASRTGRVQNRPLIIQSPRGMRRLVRMSIQRIVDGAATSFVHVFEDCADVRTLEERVVQSERLATIGKFASQVAHEIRNPLGSMSLNLELLEDQLHGAGDEARALLRSVQRELERLNDVVGEYLQFSRFPKAHLSRGKVDVVIHDLSETLKLKPSVKLEVSLMADSPEVWLDDRLLGQALHNLIRNAVEAIEGPGTIRIESDVTDRFLVIRVHDTGCGISTEVQRQLFEPFFTTKPQGSGLGLATAQQIIFEHNGHLLVESEAGKGSTFSLLLPL
jgi:two-component system, NtrC family, sensor histidine kinase AtoS